MNKLEDLIITIDNNVLTREYIDEIIHNYMTYNEIITITSMSIRHNVLGYYQHYSFGNKRIYIDYDDEKEALCINYKAKKNDMICLRICRKLSYFSRWYEIAQIYEQYGSVALDILFICVHANFCSIFDGAHATNYLVLINNNRFELYDTAFLTSYDMVADMVDKIEKSLTDEDLEAIPAKRITKLEKKYKRSNKPHEHICTSLIHKFSKYSLYDCNPIEYIIDFLYPYRY